MTLDFQRGWLQLLEAENLVIISSNDEIDMTKWRKHLMKEENWEKVGFLLIPHNSDLSHLL